MCVELSVSTIVFISWFLLIRYITITFNPLDLPKLCVYNSINTLKENFNMRKSTRSILQELSDVGLHRDPNLVIESRGSNIIQSAVNLIEQIRFRFVSILKNSTIIRNSKKNV